VVKIHVASKQRLARAHVFNTRFDERIANRQTIAYRALLVGNTMGLAIG